MPELVISASTATSLAALPPPAAFQPSLRILKRPSASPSPSSSAAVDSQQKSFAEREAQYQAARDRIFGGTPPSDASNTGRPIVKSRTPPSSTSPKLTSQNPPISNVIRNPRGPDAVSCDYPTAQSRGVSRGFRGRRGTRGSITQGPPA